MDLSVFLILLFVTLQFVAEYHNWSQYRVKLVIFIATLVLTLPNIIFMVIDWWQSPHSKIALLVLNTFKPILRGETYRLFRWLKSVGMDLVSDELNYLPSSYPKNCSDFFMTRDCFDRISTMTMFEVIPEDDNKLEVGFPFYAYTSCTGFAINYGKETFDVHQLQFSRKLRDFSGKLDGESFMNHHLFQSSLIRRQTYNNVDFPTAQRLAKRLKKICLTEMPILEYVKHRREWCYFHAASTLDYLDKDLVLIHAQGENIAVG